MKKSICLLFLVLSSLSLFSQEKLSRFSFTGYRVNIIPSDTFFIDVKNNIEADKKVTNNTLKYTIKDQTGRVPKDTVYIYTNRIDYLYLHNSELVMNLPLHVDSMAINLVSSFGILDVKANHVSIRAAAGSNLSAKGSSHSLKCSVGAGSYVMAKELMVEETDLDVMGHSSLIINSRKILKSEIKDSSMENIHREK